MARPFPLHTGLATVTAVAQVTPGMRRFELHAPAFAEPGIEQPGEILTLGWPLTGEELVLPELGWRFPNGRREQHWRNFTVRSHDPGRATIDVDFFLHGDAGRASAWAEGAKSGDEVGFAGPRTHWEPDPAADWSLLVADETGLPALMAILETLPAGHRAIAIAEVGGDAERQPVASDAQTEAHWVSRGGGAPGTSRVVLDTVEALELPEGPGQVWGGGEALVMRDVRRHLKARLPETPMRVLGYWKHDRTPDWC